MAERDENYKKEEYEPGFQRFYAYLSLFTMSMLGLVVATNIFQMYLFWELVGVCSYLLIGFGEKSKNHKNTIAILKKLCYTLLVSNTKISI